MPDYDSIVQTAARVMGWKGGKSTSKAKKLAAKRNAKKGGWPKGRKRNPNKMLAHT